MLLVIPAMLTRSGRVRRLVTFWLVLVVLEDDLGSLFRWPQSWDRKAGFRVITWNIAGQTDWPSVLGSMQSLEPDIVFLQETPDGNASLSTGTLTGYWRNFHWWDQGDCGILCRYPMTALPSEKVGPWDKPALALANVSLVEGASTVPILLCSLRLMLPSNTIYPGLIPTPEDHEIRIAQYPKLASQLMEAQKELQAAAVIVGGDFNVRGNSESLKPLSDAGLKDVWIETGRGWGGTILSDFPVARIDQIWITGLNMPFQSRVSVGKGSDHRMVVSEFPLYY